MDVDSIFISSSFWRSILRLEMLTIVSKIGSGHLRWMRLHVRDRDCERAVPGAQYAKATEVGE
jgi:hypothetical protein